MSQRMWMKWTVGALVISVGTIALAQNAAQRAALVQLARAHAHAVKYSTSKPANHVRSLNAPANGVEAINAPLELPHGLAFDTAGNLYIADTDDDVIREINLDGIISTVAGNGNQGYGGDGGSATSANAQLDSPTGVAVDSNGNIYIADSHNNRIREVSGGTITTVAGTGVAGYSGDTGPATSAMLNLPTAVAIDSNNNIYIADTNNHCIREIVGTTINTVAGNGTQGYSGDGNSATSAQLDSPNGVAVDASFNIYIGDTHNQRVRMVTHSTGFIGTIAGTGVKGFNSGTVAATAELARPRGLAVDGSGTVYFADSDNNLIRTISGAGLTTITTIAGNGSEGFSGYGGSSTSASLDTPDAVALSQSAVLFSDTQNDLIGLIEGGIINSSGGETPGVESLTISGPTSDVYGSAGTLVATFSNGGNTGTGQVTFYDVAGGSPAIVGSPQTLSANTASISTVSLSLGAHYIVASYPGDGTNAAVNSGVYVFLVTTTPTIVLGTIASPADSGTPTSITASFQIPSSGPAPTQQISFYATPTGGSGSTLLGSAPLTGSGSNYTATLTTSSLPPGLQTITATYPGDNVYTSSTSVGQGITVIANILWIGNPNPSNTTSAFSPTGTAFLSSAISDGGTGIAIDHLGNVWSLNQGPSSVAEFTSNSSPTESSYSSDDSSAGTSLAIDGLNQVWVTNADGSISVFNSGGTPINPTTGYTDGLSSPTSVAIDISGNVWIANHGSNSVTKILGAAAPTVPLATGVANIAPATKP
jgi:sugar lactone lactonase YvrE